MLIVLEGIDGSGKSTLATGLVAALESRGRAVLSTREPTAMTDAGRRLRSLLADGTQEASTATLQELFHQDRAEHVQTVVRPALERGTWVVQDRTYYSTAAYQGAAQADAGEGDADAVVESILQASRAIAPTPNLTLFLALPPEVALERVSQRGAVSRFEQLETLRTVDRIYQRLASQEPGWITLDATKPPDTLVAEALSHLAETAGVSP